VDLDCLVDGANDADGGVGAKVNGGSADGGEESLGQLAGIEAVFFKEDEAAVAWN
jgi:hypothetical protein